MAVQDQSTGAARVLAGRYRLGERLGRGGMGTVWRAWDEMLDREVAVKELTVGHLAEEDLEILQSRMKREAQAAARIKHPGVITIHDVLEQDGRPWIVMELIDGRSLSAVISEDGTLRPREAAEIGAQVLAALHRGHQLGVLHRDVKPANVLLEHGTGRAVLLDFGIARFEGSSELTRPGELVGSPDYLAPERAQGGRPGPASDLWALGATLYAAVEGDSPFRRDTPLTTLAAVVGEPLPEPRRAGALGPVLTALMAKDPADRPSAEEALRLLQQVGAGHTIGMRTLPAPQRQVPTQYVPVVDRQEATPQPAPQPGSMTVAAPPAPRRRRTGLRIALIGLATALLAGGAAFLVMNRQHKPVPPQPSPIPSDSPILPTGPAPTGYEWHDDPAGFRFLLPTEGGTWARSTDDASEIFYSPDGKVHYLEFAITVAQPLSPRQHFAEMEAGLRQKLPNYQQVSMTDVRVHGHEGAVWEFTFNSPKDGSRRHAKEEEFRNPDGTSYAIYVSGLDKDWTNDLRRFTTVSNSFTPTR